MVTGTSGQITLQDSNGNTMLQASLTPVADTNYLWGSGNTYERLCSWIEVINLHCLAIPVAARLSTDLAFEAKLGARRSQVEHINGHLSFGIDQGNLDIAIFLGKTRTDAMQKSGLVLGDHLHQRAMGR